MVIFFICFYYILGILIGFTRLENYFILYGITTLIIPIILTIVLKEYLRYGILTKSSESKLLITLTTIVFIFFDISSSLSLYLFKIPHELFLFLSLILLPSIANNILLSYIYLKFGHIPCIFYLILLKLLPIIPNYNDYLKSIISFMVPVFVFIMTYLFLKRDKDGELDRYYNKTNYLLYLVPVFIVIILVYFVSGYFKYYAIAVDSGSMKPIFDRESVVIVEQIRNNYDIIGIGDIIAYQVDNRIVIHRVTNIKTVDDEIYYYTKGDANSFEDDYKIPKETVIGVLRRKIPYVGLHIVWLSKLS